jgi:RNA polymerase sigma-70 factor (ECF subfamily)
MASDPSGISASDEGNDERAVVALFEQHRARLRRMVCLRLDRRLQGRVDPSDVLQEAHLEVARRAKEYLADPAMPAFLWLRWITGERLLDAHRRHLGAAMTKSAASNRYMRALMRLKETLTGMPGFLDP